MKAIWRLGLMAAVLAVGGLAMPAGAQGLPGAKLVSVDPAETSKYLGNVYKDEVLGFKLAPPAGARTVTRSGVDLVSFIVDEKQWGGSLQGITLDRDKLLLERKLERMTLDEYVKTLKREMQSGTTFGGVQIQPEEKIADFQGHPAVRMNSTMTGLLGSGVPERFEKNEKNVTQRDRVTLYRQELVIEMKPNSFWTLRMYTLSKDKEPATKTFDAMMKGFEIFKPVDLKAKRQATVAAGRKWLAEQSAEKLKDKLSNQPLVFRMKVAAQDVGYIEFDEMTRAAGKNAKDQATGEVDRDGQKGIAIAALYRSFPDDGTVAYGQNVAFWAYSRNGKGEEVGHYSTWDNLAKTKQQVAVRQAPGAAGPAMVTLMPWNEEMGVLSRELPRASIKEAELEIMRQQRLDWMKGNPGKKAPPEIGDGIRMPLYQIVVTHSADPTQRPKAGYKENIPLEAASPLPKILEYTWTRLVDLTKPSEMSFVVYNSKEGKPSLRNLIVTGQKETVVINGKDVMCYKCIDEMDPGFTTIWVDSSGRIQMMVTSDQSVMVPTTVEEMKAKWAGRLGDQ